MLRRTGPSAPSAPAAAGARSSDGDRRRSGELAGLGSGDVTELLSGELAARAGVGKDTLRFYERRGLLPEPRRGSNDYRRYPASAVRRVRMIRVAVAVGFSIEELAEILRTRDAGGVPCRDVRRLAGETIEVLRRDVERLIALRTDLEDVVADWDRRLAAAENGRRAGLLEALLDRADRRGGARGGRGAGVGSPIPRKS